MGKAPAHLRLQPRVRCPLSLQPALRSPPGHLGEAVLSSGPGHPPALCSWRLYPCPSSVFPVPRIDSIFQHLSLWAADSSTRRSALEGAGVLSQLLRSALEGAGVLSQLLRFVSFPRLPPVKAQGGARAGRSTGAAFNAVKAAIHSAVHSHSAGEKPSSLELKPKGSSLGPRTEKSWISQPHLDG